MCHKCGNDIMQYVSHSLFHTFFRSEVQKIFVKFVSRLSVQTEHFVCSNVFSNYVVVILCQIQLKLGKKTERQM